MVIYHHGLPLGAANQVVEYGALLSPQEQHKKKLGWYALDERGRQDLIRRLGSMLVVMPGVPFETITTEDELFRAMNPDKSQYESRYQNLTFARSIEEAVLYSIRHGTAGLILGLDFQDNGLSFLKAPKKSLDDLRTVTLNRKAIGLQDQVRKLFARYQDVKFYELLE